MRKALRRREEEEEKTRRNRREETEISIPGEAGAVRQETHHGLPDSFYGGGEAASSSKWMKPGENIAFCAKTGAAPVAFSVPLNPLLNITMASLRSQAWRRVAQRAFSHLSSSSPLLSSGLQGLPAAVSVSPTQTREHKSEGNSRTEGRKLGGSPVFSRAFGRCPRIAACAEKRTATDLGAAEDFQRGGLYELAVNGGKDKVLLSRTADGTFYCTGASCSHYSASLSKGVLTAKRTVTCPLHDAEFDLETGKCVNGPALSAIPTYPVEIKDGRVVAQIPDEVPVRARGVYAKEKRGQNTETFVLLGGGAAAATAAETLRAEGFDGKASTTDVGR
ncbi:pyridine nucleotide-disulfide oxidoreductase domain-containing protein, partial [Toxoplasma gondii RUB]